MEQSELSHSVIISENARYVKEAVEQNVSNYPAAAVSPPQPVFLESIGITYIYIYIYIERERERKLIDSLNNVCLHIYIMEIVYASYSSTSQHSGIARDTVDYRSIA